MKENLNPHPEMPLPTYDNIEGKGLFVVRAYWRPLIESRDGTYLAQFIEECDTDTPWGVYDGSPEEGWFGGFDYNEVGGLNEEEARDLFEGWSEYRGREIA